MAQTKVINETFLKLFAVKAQPYFKKPWLGTHKISWKNSLKLREILSSISLLKQTNVTSISEMPQMANPRGGFNVFFSLALTGELKWLTAIHKHFLLIFYFHMILKKLLWGQFYRTFLSVIYGFSNLARAFVRLDWKSLPMTNTLA